MSRQHQADTALLPQRHGMSVQQAADLIGVHADTIRHMIADGTLKARQTRPGGRVVVFSDSVEEFFSDAEAKPEVIESVDADLPVGDSEGARKQIAADLRAGVISPADAAALLKMLGA